MSQAVYTLTEDQASRLRSWLNYLRPDYDYPDEGNQANYQELTALLAALGQPPAQVDIAEQHKAGRS